MVFGAYDSNPKSPTRGIQKNRIITHLAQYLQKFVESCANYEGDSSPDGRRTSHGCYSPRTSRGSAAQPGAACSTGSVKKSESNALAGGCQRRDKKAAAVRHRGGAAGRYHRRRRRASRRDVPRRGSTSPPSAPTAPAPLAPATRVSFACDSAEKLLMMWIGTVGLAVRRGGRTSPTIKVRLQRWLTSRAFNGTDSPQTEVGKKTRNIDPYGGLGMVRRNKNARSIN